MFPRKTIATVGVGALALGLYLGQFGKFGLGTGSGDSVGITSTRVDAGASTATPSPSTTTTATSTKSSADIGALEGELQQMVVLQLDAGGIEVAEWGGQKAVLRRATLAEVVKLAHSRPGNAEGLRVRIRREPTSKAKLESDLQNELRAAGIPDEAVEWDGGARP
jgi:hypothetical protein